MSTDSTVIRPDGDRTLVVADRIVACPRCKRAAALLVNYLGQTTCSPCAEAKRQEHTS